MKKKWIWIGLGAVAVVVIVGVERGARREGQGRVRAAREGAA
jgi:hypothetical protein